VRTNTSVIARLVFWSGLIFGTGNTWGQPATGKAEDVHAQLPAAETLPPAEANVQALELFYAGRYREAEPLYLAALAGWERMGAVAERDRVVTAVNLGTLLRAEGRFAEAESVLLDCIRRAEALEPTGSGKSSVEWAHAASSLGALYLAWQQLDKAEAFAFQAQAIFSQRLDAGDPERVTNGTLLGTIYLEQARYEEAEVLLRATLDHADKLLAAVTYNQLAVMALRRGRLEEAESLALEASAMSRLEAAPSGRMAAAITGNLAKIRLLQKRYVEAEQNYRDAIAIAETALGKEHPETAKAYLNLATFYQIRRRDRGAEQLYRRAIEILEPVYGKDHALVLVARNELADVFRAQGRYIESERLGGASLALLEDKLGLRDPRVLRALANQERLLASTKRNHEAAALRARIQEISRRWQQAK
jgi:tetratricopeptide (TPR) repeat protein